MCGPTPALGFPTVRAPPRLTRPKERVRWSWRRCKRTGKPWIIDCLKTRAPVHPPWLTKPNCTPRTTGARWGESGRLRPSKVRRRHRRGARSHRKKAAGCRLLGRVTDLDRPFLRRRPVAMFASPECDQFKAHTRVCLDYLSRY